MYNYFIFYLLRRPKFDTFCKKNMILERLIRGCFFLDKGTEEYTNWYYIKD